MQKDDFNEYKRQLEEMEEDDSFFYKYASEKELRKQKKKRSKQMKKLAKKAEKYKKQRREQKRKQRLKAEKEEFKQIQKQKKEEEQKERLLKKEDELLKKIKNKEEIENTAQEYFAENPEEEIYDGKESLGNKDKRKKHPIRAFLILLFLAVLIFVLINFESLNPENITDFISGLFSGNISGSEEIKIADATVISVGKTDKDLLLLTDTSILGYSKNGALQFERQHGYQSPRMKSANSYSVVYENMGKKFRIDSRNKTILEKNTENNILSADISNNKTLALVTESEGYAAELTLYDFNFEPKSFKWYSAEHNVIDMSISPNGEKAAIATCGAENGQMISRLVLLDFSKDKPIATIEYKDSFIFSVDFKTNTDVTVVGDNICSSVPVNNVEKKKEYKFPNYKLKLYTNNDSDGCVMALEKHSDIASNLIVFISPQGEVYFEKTADEAVNAVALSGKKCLVLSKSGLSQIDRDGNGSFISSVNTDGLLVQSLGGSVFVIGNSVIQVLS